MTVRSYPKGRPRKMMRLAGILVSVSTLVVASHAFGHDAPEEETLPDRFSLAIGGFLLDHTNSEVRLDRPGFPLGVRVNLEDDLEVSGTNSVVRVDSYYRFSSRHRVDLTWYRFKRTGFTNLGKEISFGDIVFPTASGVDSQTRLTVVKLSYLYSFYHEPRVELGLGAGLHFVDYDYGLDALQLDLEDSGGGLAPLPNVGFFLDYSISSQFHVVSQTQLFFIKVGDYKGSLGDFTATLEYRPFTHGGAGIGFNRFTLDVEMTATDFTGIAEVAYSGLMFYVVGKF